MSVSAIRPIQGQQIAWSPQAGRKTDPPRLADRNAGPDTVSISPEALALSKTARADTLDDLIQEVAGEETAFAENLAMLPHQLAVAGGDAATAGPGALAATAMDPAAAALDDSSFGRILRRELIRAINSYQGFAGQTAVMGARG